ncbi:MAG: hypothetical protein WA688_04280, partial [Thermoplasmata archaeon]
MTEIQTFDLSTVAGLYDKNRLRLGRWLAGLFAVVFLVTAVWKGLGPIGSIYYVPGLVGGVTFDFWLWWFALYFFGPPPFTVSASPDAVRFTFKSGRATPFNLRERGLRVKLAETLPPADSTRRIIQDPPFFAIRRFRWLPLTPESFASIVTELERA